MDFKINVVTGNVQDPVNTVIDISDEFGKVNSWSNETLTSYSDDIQDVDPTVPTPQVVDGLDSDSSNSKQTPRILTTRNPRDSLINNKIFKEDRDHTLLEIYFNRYILVLVLSLLTSILVYRFVMPFLPFMVLTFYPNDDKTELGYKTGWLTTSLNIGGFLGSILWGYIADWYGRRRAMIYSLFLTTIVVILFGFSSNFIYSIFIRVLWGLVNGGSGVTKTMMAEVCNSHDAPIALSFLGTSDSIGK